MIANKVESFPTVMGNNSAMAPNHFATSSNHLKLNNRRNGNIASVPASVSNSRSRLHAQFVTIERRQKIQKKKNSQKINRNEMRIFQPISSCVSYLLTFFLSFFATTSTYRETHTHTHKNLLSYLVFRIDTNFPRSVFQWQATKRVFKEGHKP